MTTGGFVGEREGRTWEVLLTTPLSAREIAWGKLAGALHAQWFLPAVILGHVVLSVAAGVVRPILLLHMLLILAGPTLLFSATGLLLSLVFKKSTPASVGNLFLALLFWLVPWLALALIAFVFERTGGVSQSFLENWYGVLAAFNPVAMAVSAYEGALAPLHSWRGAAPPYGMPGFGNASPLPFTLALAAVFAFYALLAAAVFRLTLAAFKRFGGRAS
jgi:ABC-type transport system involved in multi-copper enzyme maturation permease subunit